MVVSLLILSFPTCSCSSFSLSSRLYSLQKSPLSLQQFFLNNFVLLLLRTSKMARPFELVKDINDTKELWKIAVRVHHKWTVVNKNKEHFEMLLCDKEGSDIHCRVPTMYKQAFDSLLTVNGTVTVSNFQVSLNDLLFKPSDHKFVLTFSGGTSVTDINKHEIPPRPLKFTPFADILTGKWKRDVLIDVIGMVSDIGYTQIQDGNKKQQINLVLKDLCNNILNCTLWEGYAMQFHDFNKQRKDLSSPIVIVLQFAKVKEEGKYPVCVSNTFNVTMLHINDDLAEIKEFLNSIPKQCLADTSGQSMTSMSQLSQTSGSSQLSPYDKFMYKALVLPLSVVKKLTALLKEVGITKHAMLVQVKLKEINHPTFVVTNTILKLKFTGIKFSLKFSTKPAKLFLFCGTASVHNYWTLLLLSYVTQCLRLV
ncbi:uncharacterized protein LOC131611176 isoform X2 [Vicia villosa]|uniref:uncharacterized protein LOC131611176 isoform X2 n=1 Tax=Vicia villosa TaxID=3911 RepID=UPI00273BE883|nr:uncharacterized protein LOC131611176 isoform X2 [Vicia villosa]